MKPNYLNILQEEKGYKTFEIPKLNLPRYQNPPPPPNTCVRNWDYLNKKWMKPVHSNRCFGKCKNIAYRLTEEMLPPKPSKLTKYIPFMKILLLAGLLTLFTCSSQPADSSKPIFTGTNNWKLMEAVYGKETIHYFNWEFTNTNYGTRNSNGKKVGFLNYYYQQHVRELANMLWEFGNLTTNTALEYDFPGYHLKTVTTNNYIYLTDHDGCSFKFSKTSARKMADEMYKQISILELDKDSVTVTPTK